MQDLDLTRYEAQPTVLGSGVAVNNPPVDTELVRTPGQLEPGLYCIEADLSLQEVVAGLTFGAALPDSNVRLDGAGGTVIGALTLVESPPIDQTKLFPTVAKYRLSLLLNVAVAAPNGIGIYVLAGLGGANSWYHATIKATRIRS